MKMLFTLLMVISTTTSILGSVIDPESTTTIPAQDSIIDSIQMTTTLLPEVNEVDYEPDPYDFASSINPGHDCGHRMIRFPKIINGSNALHGNHPWMISLMLNHRHHCGGSLINANWILTAAHCVFMVQEKRFQVKLGGHVRNKDGESTSVVVDNVTVIAHPGFTFATFADDLALVRMPKRISFGPYIQPICLPDRISERMVNDKAMVIGWGKLKPGGYSAEALQEVELPIVDNLKCINWYREMGKMLSIRPSQICAGLERGGKDACQGDSGSPMLITDQLRKRSTVVGIVSAGIGCALPKLPGLYTRVSSYLPWIQEIMEQYDRKFATTTTTTTTTSAPTTTVVSETVLETTTTSDLVNDGQNSDQPMINTEATIEQQEWTNDANNDSSRPTLEDAEPTGVTEHDNLLSLITSSCCQ